MAKTNKTKIDPSDRTEMEEGYRANASVAKKPMTDFEAAHHRQRIIPARCRLDEGALCRLFNRAADLQLRLVSALPEPGTYSMLLLFFDAAGSTGTERELRDLYNSWETLPQRPSEPLK